MTRGQITKHFSKTLSVLSALFNIFLSGNPGTRTLSNIMKPISRGPFGETSQNRTLTYTWKAVPKSDFVLAIVTSSEYENSELEITDQGGKENYHRIDLNPEDYENHLCKYSGDHVAIKGTFFSTNSNENYPNQSCFKKFLFHRFAFVRFS